MKLLRALVIAVVEIVLRVRKISCAVAAVEYLKKGHPVLGEIRLAVNHCCWLITVVLCRLA